MNVTVKYKRAQGVQSCQTIMGGCPIRHQIAIGAQPAEVQG